MRKIHIDEEEWAARKLRLSTMQIVALGFMGIILAGGLLLWLVNHRQECVTLILPVYAIFKPAANFVSGCSVHCGYVRLCDRTGDGCTGNAVYTDRQRDHAGAYSDRRTGRDRLYIGIFSVA